MTKNLRAMLTARSGWLMGTAVCATIALAYLTTLQRDVNGLSDLVDAGEFQNALYLWGIVHPTGYPLYLIMGGLFVHAVHALGVNPAAAASLFSLAGSIGALVFFFASIRLQTRSDIVAAAGTLLLGVVNTFWLRSIDAEVYSWSFFFVALTLYLTLRFYARPRPQLLLAILFVLGTGIAHHRFVGLILPAVVIWTGPEAWQLVRANRRLIPAGIAVLLIPFAIYLYLPLRSSWGSKWEFASVDTWTAFWSMFTGRGYLDSAFAIPTSLAAAWAQTKSVIALLAGQLSPPGLGLGCCALLLLLRSPRTRRPATAVSVGALVVILFAVVYQIRDIDAYLIPATLLFIFGAVSAIELAGSRRKLFAGGIAASVLALAVALAPGSWSMARVIGADGSGRELLDTVQPLAGPKSVLMAPWGTNFFAFWYGQYVTAELPPTAGLITADRSIKPFLARGLRVITPKDTLYTSSLQDWDEELGHAYLRSAGPGLIEISNHPALEPDLENAPGEAAFGSVVTLVKQDTAYDSIKQTLALTLYWRSEEKIPADYSVMVHLVDPSQGDRILLQADSSNPVYGFYPTSRWQKGEVVREDYQLRVPGTAKIVGKDLLIGWYRRDPVTGRFDNLDTFRLQLPLSATLKGSSSNLRGIRG